MKSGTERRRMRIGMAKCSRTFHESKPIWGVRAEREMVKKTCGGQLHPNTVV